MKILYDHQIFTLQKYGGISRYFCDLMTQFSKDPAMDYSLALRFSFNEHLLPLPQLDPFWSDKSSLYTNAHFHSLMKNATRSKMLQRLITEVLLPLNRKESERLLKKQDFDLFHPTYYDPYFLRHIQKKPFVITVYDMIHEIYPKDFPVGDPISAWKKRVLEKADGIIAISESTKSDITRIFPVDPDRIHVIHLGNPFEERTDPAQYKSPSDPHLLTKPYILFVGNRSGYKNFEFFINAAAEIIRKDDEMQVLCAGGGPYTLRENEILKNLQIQGRVHQIQPDDLFIKNLYTHARAFIFPSLYEGFGLPVLEAFSCGCPALLCNSSSLPEIGGDAALYFDPLDPVSFSNALERILTDENLRTQLINRGHERLKQFSWENTAKATKKVYENLGNH